MVRISTSQFKYRGEDRLDITYKSNSVFAPTKELVYGFKYHGLSQESYFNQYKSLMEKSYTNNQAEWNRILNLKTVVFVCFCPANEFCHRVILANFFTVFGAEYCGEILMI